MDPQPSTFSAYARPLHSRRPWGAAACGCLLVCALLLLLLNGLSGTRLEVVAEKRVDLTFVEKITKPEPPPMPVPDLITAPVPQAAAAPAAAPVVPPQQKIRKLDKPPPAKPLVAPQVMPHEIPAEADPSEDKGVAVYGEPGHGDPAGLEGGMASGVAGGEVGVIEMPDDAVAPRPLSSNQRPLYPQSARRLGRSGTVTLKLAILADGSVGEISVKEGEEPFVSAAREAVRRWRFEPARRNGVAISVYRELPIAFHIAD